MQKFNKRYGTYSILSFFVISSIQCSKFRVSLEEYPYHLWPPYVSGNANVLSRDVLFDMYYASFFVKRVRFEDVYQGLIAKKLHLKPFHCPEFYQYGKPYSLHGYR